MASLPRAVSLLPLDSTGEAVAGWGQYQESISRWEAILRRPAPAPLVPGKTRPRLNPELSEFLMGVPKGWITDVPGTSRQDQFKCTGNGVVPQQAALALRILLNRRKGELCLYV